MSSPLPLSGRLGGLPRGHRCVEAQGDLSVGLVELESSG